MRAAEVHTPGQPPVAAERTVPAAGRDEVLVDVAAAPVTPLDLLCATGTSYFGVPITPYVPGVQGVGTVGGRPVWFATSAGMAPGDGSMAEQAVVATSDVVELPDGVDPMAMAALGLSAVAAHQALTWRGELAAGETVLVLGGGGVVGQVAIQLARLHGASRVVAAARSVTGQQRAWGAGADAVVPLDTDDVVALASRFREAAGGEVDLVLDPLYGAPAAAAAKSLRAHGRLVNLGSSAHEHAPIDSSTLRSRSLRLLGYTNNELSTERRADAVRAVASYAADGRLSVAREVLPLEAVGEAWQRQAEGRTTGRLVLSMG
ncbi:MAG: zinc-binding dehydrogenase [Marmoricola sp.]|nr:zinc-binding dehydrogenase [Marmoricola sp.]